MDLWLIIPIVLGLYCWRLSIRFFYKEFYVDEGDKPSWVGVAGLLVFSLCICYIAGPWQWCDDRISAQSEKERSFDRSDAFLRRLGGESKTQKLERKQNELEALAKRNSQLERELELVGGAECLDQRSYS